MKSIATILWTGAMLSALHSDPALSAPPPEPMQAVSLADIDLDAPSATNTIYKRIERAARAVCQIPGQTRQLSIEAGIRACQASAIRRAVLQANLPALTALHLAKTGHEAESAQYADRH